MNKRESVFHSSFILQHQEAVYPVQRLSPPSRVSLAFVCLTAAILAIAAVAGLVPDRNGAILDGRKALCEQMAVHASLAAQRGDLAAVRASALAAVRRNPDIVSAGVRAADGRLLTEAGDHRLHWAPAVGGGATQMRVPIALQGQLWGHLELRFRPLDGGAWAPLHNPALLLLAFVAVTGFVAYSVYLRVLFRKLGLAQSSVVPRRVRTTLNTLAEGVVILDKHHRIALANEAFARLVGLPAADLPGRDVSEFSWTGPRVHGGDAGLPWERALGEGAAQTGTILGLLQDRQAHTLSVNSTPIVGEDGTPRGAFATFDNLTTIERKNAHLRKLLQKLKVSRAEVRRQNQELKVLATRDPLTGCLNRRAFFGEFETHWSASARHALPLGCIMVDIDHFKGINDTHGHGVGDQVLQHIAATLRSLVRKTDLVCRYGGEEFCILLPHTDLADSALAAERYRAGIEASRCGAIAVTTSVGVSALNLGAHEPRELLDQADKSLYAAKRGGRNRVVRWDEILDKPELARAEPRQSAPPGPPCDVAIPFHAVTALLSALAYRHADTAEHSRRVADLCVATASGLMTQSECYILEVAATLHDIGKLGVPDAVLLKPGPLTADEWKVIRTHEGIGDEILAAAFTSDELSEIVRSHHCWYGGSPHDPDLPHGKDIPLGARILMIADAYDAIVSDRVYRKGRSRLEAFAELRRCAGVQFDPDLVERFVEAVLARDETRAPTAVPFSKQTALKIGVQIEKLASALDAEDHRGLATMAGYLSATARAHGLAPIAETAARLERSAGSNPNRVEVTQLTVDLLDLCRATYRCYLPGVAEDISA